MKILHCIPSLQGGGAERQLLLLSREQRLRGDSVHIAFVSGDPDPGSGVEFHQLNAAGNHDPRIVVQLWNLAREIRPDVMQTWLTQMDFAGGIAARITRTPWVISERSNPLAYEMRFKDGFFRKRVGRHADAAVANSEQGSMVWRGNLANGGTAHVISNAVDLSGIAAVPVATDEAVGVKTGEQVVLFAGRLSEEKRIDEVLAAADKICDRPGTAFVICGEGVLKPHLLGLIAASRNRDRIHYLGFRNDIWSIMKRSSVLVNPSRFEGNPNVVIEAMACGAALVVSDIPAHREFLDESTAVLVPIDAGECARAVTSLLNDPDRRERQAWAAREKISSRRPDIVADAYDAIYREAILKRRGATPGET